MGKNIADKALSYTNFIIRKIEEQPLGTPIFSEEITKMIINEFVIELMHARTIVNSTFNRLKKKAILEHFDTGIYYRPKITAFGKSSINPESILIKKYIKVDSKIIGYETGPSFLQRIGLTTQIPKNRFIATNVALQTRNKNIQNMNVVLQKPKTEVTEFNVKYLQILDAIDNKECASINKMTYYFVVNKFIDENNLGFDRLLGITKKYYSDKLVKKVADIAAARL